MRSDYGWKLHDDPFAFADDVLLSASPKWTWLVCNCVIELKLLPLNRPWPNTEFATLSGKATRNAWASTFAERELQTLHIFQFSNRWLFGVSPIIVVNLGNDQTRAVTSTSGRNKNFTKCLRLTNQGLQLQNSHDLECWTTCPNKEIKPPMRWFTHCTKMLEGWRGKLYWLHSHENNPTSWPRLRSRDYIYDLTACDARRTIRVCWETWNVAIPSGQQLPQLSRKEMCVWKWMNQRHALSILSLPALWAWSFVLSNENRLRLIMKH